MLFTRFSSEGIGYTEKRKPFDGEGGYTVSGGLRPAAASIGAGYLPLGLAHQVKLKNAITDGAAITWDDVEIDETTTAYKLRRWMETNV